MIKFILFFLFLKKFICYNFKSTELTLVSNKKITNPLRVMDGYDQIYPKNIDESLLLKNIIRNYHYYSLLTELERDDISINHKLKLIDKEFPKNEIKPFNIMNGGLLNDFNFELD